MPADRRLPVVTALAATALALAGCIATPQPISVPIDLGGVQLDVSLPASAEMEEGAIAASTCADARQVVHLAGDRQWVSFATTSPATACPDEEALNGRFPSWSSVDELPTDAVLDHPSPSFTSVHRFTVEYTECTNSCSRWPVEVAFLDLTNGAALIITGFNVEPGTFNEMLSTVVLR